MSEEKIYDETVTAEPQVTEDVLPQYKKTALVVGTYVMICFLLRYIGTIVINGAYDALNESLPYDIMYITELALSACFLQIAPSVIGAFMFRKFARKGAIKEMYRIPKSNARAVGNFSAVYGLAQAVNLITVLVIFIFTSKADITKKLNTVAEAQSSGIKGALFMFFMLVVIAPLFEEFMFRGLIMDALKPYGNGLAIFTSGLLFGLYHGNFNQCFYTAAAGIALGYIANVTGSIFPTTIIHAIMNSIGGIMLLLMSTNGVQEYILRGNEQDIPDSDMIWLAIFGIFMVSVFILIIVGVISAFMKIKQIKRYKVPKICPEISNGKKTAILLTTVPSIIAILLIIGTYAGVPGLIVEAMFGGAA